MHMAVTNIHKASFIRRKVVVAAVGNNEEQWYHKYTCMTQNTILGDKHYNITLHTESEREKPQELKCLLCRENKTSGRERERERKVESQVLHYV